MLGATGGRPNPAMRDAPRQSRDPTYSREERDRVIGLTLELPPDGTTHWSARRMAARTGISITTVQRICAEANVATGEVTAEGPGGATPAPISSPSFGASIASIPVRNFTSSWNNVSAHERPAVRARLERHPRITFHFTPMSASWLNQILETWFSILSRQAIHRGSFRSVKDLIAAIETFARNWNAGATALTWVRRVTRSCLEQWRKSLALQRIGTRGSGERFSIGR